MDAYSMPATKFLMGLGILGRLLQKEQPVTALRRALEVKGFTPNEITLLFDALRHGRIRGLTVNVRLAGNAPYWSLADSTFHA
jgi:hypothetical protein